MKMEMEMEMEMEMKMKIKMKMVMEMKMEIKMKMEMKKKIKYKFIIRYHKCSIAEKLHIFLCAKFCHFVPWSGVYYRVGNLNK